MNQDFQLKVQAYLDGELSGRESREVETALAGDAEARALLTELRHTSGALAVFEAELKLPETREFFWSKVRREIQRQQTSEPARPPAVSFWRRWLLPAGAFAALAIAAMLGWQQIQSPPLAQRVIIETELADSGAMTYRDEVERMTVVWLSYPVENEFARLE